MKKINRRGSAFGERTLPVALALLQAFSISARAQTESPSVCVALLTDVSTSVTGDQESILRMPTQEPSSSQTPINEYQLQKIGTANAIQSAPVKQKIADSPRGVGFVYIEFADNPVVRVAYRVTHTNEDADKLSGEIRSLRRSMIGATGIGDAVLYAVEELLLKCPEAHKIIDVAGDGENNTGTPSTIARDRAMSYNITINGLPILNLDPINGDPYVVRNYRTKVITPNGFIQNTTHGFVDFEAAMASKLSSEISGLPPRRPFFAFAPQVRFQKLSWPVSYATFLP